MIISTYHPHNFLKNQLGISFTIIKASEFLFFLKRINLDCYRHATPSAMRFTREQKKNKTRTFQRILREISIKWHVETREVLVVVIPSVLDDVEEIEALLHRLRVCYDLSRSKDVSLIYLESCLVLSCCYTWLVISWAACFEAAVGSVLAWPGLAVTESIVTCCVCLGG
jgi:hypothetical protein